jgi:hypothetical protein
MTTNTTPETKITLDKNNYGGSLGPFVKGIAGTDISDTIIKTLDIAIYAEIEPNRVDVTIKTNLLAKTYEWKNLVRETLIDTQLTIAEATLLRDALTLALDFEAEAN